MRARLVVQALCGQVLLAIAVSQVGTVCPNPPVADQSMGQFMSAPLDLIASDSDTQTLEATIRRLAGTDAVFAADPVRFAERSTARVQTAVAARLAEVVITVDRQALRIPLTVNPADLARTRTSATAAQPVSPIRWSA
jgi:hypothetical protein